MAKILILTAIPHNLRLDKEIREIEDAIRRSMERDRFTIAVRTAVRPKDIRRAIAEEQPQIVHFCGHGTKTGKLVLDNDIGKIVQVEPEALASLFKLHANVVQCVVLNACYSEKPAEAIARYINYVIGMNQAVNDNTAIVFSTGFYDALGYDSIEEEDKFQRAFEEGKVSIELESLPGYKIPVLKKKKVNGISDSPVTLEVPIKSELTVNLNNRQQIQHLQEQLRQDYDLLKDLENRHRYETDILNKGKLKQDIANLKKDLADHEKELSFFLKQN